MENYSKSSRKTLAEKFSMDEESLKCFTDQAIFFLRYSNSKHFDIIFDSSSPRIIFKKAKWIKDYFKTTGEDSSDYKGKIKNGKLSITSNQLENYVSKKRKSDIEFIL